MINETIKNYIVHHDRILESLVNEAEIPADSLKRAILYSLFPGGKRLRPLLVYLSGEMLGLAKDCLDPIAAAVELTHCYSLVHDDLPAMDNDDLRRGKASCHIAFDEATAILAGDAMQALAIEILLKHLPLILKPAEVIKISQELLRASGASGMVSGQCLDLSELNDPEINESKLRLIHSLKTGQLISVCIKMVLIAARPNQSISESLIDFANSLGLVFQMQDDYLDHYDKSDTLGKRQNSDRVNKKITYASLYTKDALLGEIDQLYQTIQRKLLPFGLKADTLLALMDHLHKRTA